MKRIPVLDKGWVQLEECMGGDEAVIRGARICYQSHAQSPEDDVRLIRRLMKSEPKHNTVGFLSRQPRKGCSMAHLRMNATLHAATSKGMAVLGHRGRIEMPSRDRCRDGVGAQFVNHHLGTRTCGHEGVGRADEICVSSKGLSYN